MVHETSEQELIGLAAIDTDDIWFVPHALTHSAVTLTLVQCPRRLSACRELEETQAARWRNLGVIVSWSPQARI